MAEPNVIHTYSNRTLTRYCDRLGEQDARLKAILGRYGYPPFWHRGDGFDGLVRIILEQQVSLASALSVFQKLTDCLGTITPAGFLTLGDETLRNLGFSRQKTGYVRGIAREILAGRLDLTQMAELPDETVQKRLKRLKGIGDWTADIFLVMGLHRLDVFPSGDLALVKSLRHLRFVSPTPSKEEIAAAAQAFKPLRSIFAVLLWHAYIQRHCTV